MRMGCLPAAAISSREETEALRVASLECGGQVREAGEDLRAFADEGKCGVEGDPEIGVAGSGGAIRSCNCSWS
jgi:hypothetical protein